MATDKPVYVSAEGLAKLEEELEHLRTERRKEVAERIHSAMEFGDYSENSELEDAKNEQAFMEGRILTSSRCSRTLSSSIRTVITTRSSWEATSSSRSTASVRTTPLSDRP